MNFEVNFILDHYQVSSRGKLYPVCVVSVQGNKIEHFQGFTEVNANTVLIVVTLEYRQEYSWMGRTFTERETFGLSEFDVFDVALLFCL